MENIKFAYEELGDRKRGLSFVDEDGLYHGPRMIQNTSDSSLTIVYYNHGVLFGPYIYYKYGYHDSYKIDISTKAREIFNEYLGNGLTIALNEKGLSCGNKSDIIFNPDDLWVHFEWDNDIKISYSQADNDSIYHETDLPNYLYDYKHMLDSLHILTEWHDISDEYFEYQNMYIPNEMKHNNIGNCFYSMLKDNGYGIYFGKLEYERSRYFTGFNTSNKFAAFMTKECKPLIKFKNKLCDIEVRENLINIKGIITLECDEEQRKILEALGVKTEDVVNLVKLTSDSLTLYSEGEKLNNINYFAEVFKYKVELIR